MTLYIENTNIYKYISICFKTLIIHSRLSQLRLPPGIPKIFDPFSCRKMILFAHSFYIIHFPTPGVIIWHSTNLGQFQIKISQNDFRKKSKCIYNKK